MTNYYVILEIPNFSDELTIKKAYRALSKKYHPDINKDFLAIEYFLKIKEAYEILKNTNSKLVFDNKLKYFLQFGIHSPIEILYFKIGQKTYSIHDAILIEWKVSNAHKIFINPIGWVNPEGKTKIYVENYCETLLISIYAYDSNNKIISQQSEKLYHKEKDSYRAAFYRQKTINKNIDSKHFFKEKEFSKYGRINKDTFWRRILKCVIFVYPSIWIGYSLMNNSLFIGLVIICGIWYMSYQFIKRVHDLKGTPETQFTSIFLGNSFKDINDFGPPPIKIPKRGLFKFSQLETMGKWCVYSFLIMVFSYLLPLLLPKYHMEEIPENISYYAIQRKNEKDIVYQLHFSDFNIHIKASTVTKIRNGAIDKFIVVRSYLMNKPLYIEIIPNSQRKLENSRYYTGLNDYQNIFSLVLILLVFFNMWLLYNTKDRSIKLFRKICFGLLTAIYLVTAIKEWL